MPQENKNEENTPPCERLDFRLFTPHAILGRSPRDILGGKYEIMAFLC